MDQEKRQKAQITNTKNGKGDITTDPIDIKRIMKNITSNFMPTESTT